MKKINQFMRTTLADKVLVPVMLSAVVGLAGCQQEGTAEKAGQKIDRAVEKGEQKIEQSTIDATQKIEAAKESLDQQADEASEYIDESAEDSRQALDKAGEDIEQAKEDARKQLESAQQSVEDKAQATGEFLDDSVITLKVKTALVNDPLLKASQIEVTTVNGVVKLSGTVDSQQVVDRALELAASQQNVQSVQSSLIVTETPSVE